MLYMHFVGKRKLKNPFTRIIGLDLVSFSSYILKMAKIHSSAYGKKGWKEFICLLAAAIVLRMGVRTS